ncbi:MAG: hypothetical protein P4L46_13255 [Fimbriimonas sp.]|nr:hypothetical protein [Fimbriimonas sp.]
MHFYALSPSASLPARFVLLDTNIIVGNFNPRDDHHDVASGFMGRLASQGYIPVLGVSVIVEAHGMLKSRGRGYEEFLSWACTPGQALLMPEDPELVDPAKNFAVHFAIDFVDAFLTNLMRDIRTRCPLIPKVPIATLDTKDFLRQIGHLDCPLELMDLETLEINQYMGGQGPGAKKSKTPMRRGSR